MVYTGERPVDDSSHYNAWPLSTGLSASMAAAEKSGRCLDALKREEAITGEWASPCACLFGTTDSESRNLWAEPLTPIRPTDMSIFLPPSSFHNLWTHVLSVCILDSVLHEVFEFNQLVHARRARASRAFSFASYTSSLVLSASSSAPNPLLNSRVPVHAPTYQTVSLSRAKQPRHLTINKRFKGCPTSNIVLVRVPDCSERIDSFQWYQSKCNLEKKVFNN